MNPLTIIQTIIGPVAEIFQKRQERKMARESARAKVTQAKVEGEKEVLLKDQELEHINSALKKDSFLDEFVTVSLFLIFYGIGFGAVLAAWGHSQMLEGVSLAVRTLVEMGVDVGFLIEAVTLSAVGLTVWRRA